MCFIVSFQYIRSCFLSFRAPKMFPSIKGIIFALSACFIWGMIFVIPQYMGDFNCLEVAMGRYSFYGIISASIFIVEYCRGSCRYPLKIWSKALVFSLMSTFVYYTSVVLALRFSTPAVTALILGISPIAIAFYGNWKLKECSYRSLMLPSLLILAGLVMINMPHFTAVDSPLEYVLGLLCSMVALMAWSWYVVANAQFLKSHPEISSNDWSTLMGVTTILWVGLFGIVLVLFSQDNAPAVHSDWTSFFIGSAILGFVCSWTGAFLWNRASYYLPVSLAGQLTIFETLFGLLFVYSIAQELPPLMECLGIILLTGAVIYGIRVSTHSTVQHAIT